MNRKHRCRISKRHVRDAVHQTSGEGGVESRVSDGHFLGRSTRLGSEQPVGKRNKIARKCALTEISTRLFRPEGWKRSPAVDQIDCLAA
jgi:hypothetical protein